MTEAYPPETDQAGTVTSFIALPTVFTPPSSCSSIYRLNGFSLVAYDPGFGLDIDSRVRCAPAAVTTWWEQGRLGINGGEGHTAVSIGPLTCPDGWNTVATSAKDETSTLAMCCPPDYTLANKISGSVAGDCRSNILTGAVITFASTSVTNTRDWTMATTTVARPIFAGAIAIVGWTFSTTASETAPPSTLSLEETGAVTTQPERPDTASGFPHEATTSEAFTTATSPALTTTTPPPSAGLPLPTTIGIAVGAGLGAIVLAALAFFLWRRKRKQQRRSEPPPADDLQRPMPVKPDKYLYVAKHHELYGQQPEVHLGAAEMPVPQYFAELDAVGRERA
ncbi:hypothetical protein LY76DRAFT_570921 [Colletotrichum caudatum]|nr:hypothetical protein LY76DRAFT_570921 [Colletotrichum caudatum]